tara:strand:+ start:387 stop:527 length:141 start_codon:yes stop_codon:yes gene_type:complete
MLPLGLGVVVVVVGHDWSSTAKQTPMVVPVVVGSVSVVRDRMVPLV